MQSGQPMQALANFDVADFLANYWQRKPLVIRKALDSFTDPISADELAGLACEPDVESRLIVEKPKSGDWQLKHGPFRERDFVKLPASHWTLLVQAVDLWSEDVAALKRFFRFIPDWRLDDVMISFAAPQGSVGPHFDNYDVFLVQGQGTRTWRLGQYCGDDEPLLPHPSLRLLKRFATTEEVILEPGDILYVPPRIAHWGIANDEALTYSIGYRAPSVSEMLSSLVDDIGDSLSDRLRYTDPVIDRSEHPARIPDSAVDRVRALVAEALIDDNRIRDWFGRYMTEPKYRDLQPEPESWPLPKKGDVVVSPDARLAFTETTLFANGHRYPRCANDQWLIELIDRRRISVKTVKTAGQAAMQLLQQLFDHGVLGTDE
jgi:50S ribosomal protein L16 3-hydroxylase